LILYTESAWKVFTGHNIPSARAYLFVHYPSDQKKDRLFTRDIWHAEEELIKDFKEDYKKRYKAGDKQIKLEVYLTHSINYAGQLKVFAEEYSFHLNIVVGVCREKEEELRELMREKEEELREFIKNEEQLCELMKESEKSRRKLIEKKEEELCYLMTSGYCTVRSFTKYDYETLAKYLHFPIIPQATIVNRDEKTEEQLRKTQYSEYN